MASNSDKMQRVKQTNKFLPNSYSNQSNDIICIEPINNSVPSVQNRKSVVDCCLDCNNICNSEASLRRHTNRSKERDKDLDKREWSVINHRPTENGTLDMAREYTW